MSLTILPWLSLSAIG